MVDRREDTVHVPDFEAVYAEDQDPWSVADSFYEQRKLNLVLAALSQPRYHLGWDSGCGTGHLLSRLSARCDRVVGSDASAEAVRITSETCADLANVTVLRSPAQCDPGEALRSADLIVISEFLYYLDDDERRQALAGSSSAVSRPRTPGAVCASQLIRD